jgi:hypothetical protein
MSGFCSECGNVLPHHRATCSRGQREHIDLRKAYADAQLAFRVKMALYEAAGLLKFDKPLDGWPNDLLDAHRACLDAEFAYKAASYSPADKLSEIGSNQGWRAQ